MAHIYTYIYINKSTRVIVEKPREPNMMHFPTKVLSHFSAKGTQQWDGGFISHYVGWGFISSLEKKVGKLLQV